VIVEGEFEVMAMGQLRKNYELVITNTPYTVSRESMGLLIKRK
jgi:hypothetical protein